MRSVSLKNGSKLNVRGMTRREIREKSDCGLGYSTCDMPREKFDEVCDYALANQFSQETLDGLENMDILALFDGIIRETYGHPGEEKNLSTSGPSDQTQPE